MADDREPRSRRFGWKFRLLLVMIASGVLIAFAPTIVAKTGLRNWVVARLTSDVRGEMRAGGARLSWFSEPELFDVELRDDQGKVIAQAPRIQVGRTLVGLALNPKNLGIITLERPVVELIATNDETNLERVFAAYLEGDDDSPTQTAIQLDVQAGTLRLTDAEHGGTWLAADVVGSVSVPREAAAPIKVVARGQLQGDKPSSLELSLEYRGGQGGAGRPPQVVFHAQAEAMPAAAIAALIRRVEPGLRLDGVIAGQLKIVWDDSVPEHPVLQLNGHITGRSIAVSAPRYSDDRVELASLDLPCQVIWADKRIVAENFRIKCDLGEASLRGTIDLSSGPLGLLEAPGVSATCDLDLARLMRLLSKPLRLQAATRITAGRLAGDVRSTADGNGVIWSGRLLAVDLRGEHRGQPIAWDTPVSADFAARQVSGSLPKIDRCRITSEFGRLDATGNEEQLTIQGNLDLGLLSRKLGQLIDLGDLVPSGMANGQVVLKRDQTGSFSLGGDAKLRDFSVALPGGTFREPDLNVKVEAAGRTKGPAYRLETAGLHVTAGADRLDLDLLEPISDLAYVRDGHARVSLRGDLNRWRGWLAQFVTLPTDWQLAGAADASARMRVRPDSLDIDGVQAQVANFRFSGAGLNIIEPRMTFKPSSIKWDRKSQRFEVTEAEFSSSALGVRVPTLVVETKSGSLTASGQGRVAGDAARLQQWLPPVTREPITGALDGTFDFHAEGGRVRGGFDLNARGVLVGDAKHPTWNEPLVRIIAKGRFEPAADMAVLDEFRVESTTIGVAASGRVSRLNTTRELLLTGDLAYDLERFEPQLRQLIGKDVRVVGRDRTPFRLEGPLTVAKLTTPPPGSAATPSGPLGSLKGEAGFNWKELSAFGCQIGPATVRARMLGDGWIRITPIETTLNGGKLRLEPYVRLEPAPMTLAFGKATGVDRARLTPDFSSGSLGYAAPLLAGLRDPQGEVSVVIDGGQVPLADPERADIWGKFVVHTARATPGPILTQLGVMLKTPVNVNLTREMVVPFRLVNGRVYHENLELPLGELTIKSAGWVGLDGSLNLTIEFPVPPRWFKNPPKSPPIVKLPIGGTLSSPRIDERGLQQVLAERVTDAVGDAIRREAENRIKNLFQPPKK